MRALTRSLRIKSVLLLPDGEQIRVNVDAEANLIKLNAALNDVIAAAHDYGKSPMDEEKARRFYLADRALLIAVLGERDFKRALAAYGGDLCELCTQLDGWLAEDVAPTLRAASDARFKAKIRSFNKQEQRALRRARRG